MQKRLRNISDADFDRFLNFATDHPAIVKRDHLLQKLTIFNFVAPVVERHKPETILEIGCGLGFHSALLTNYGRVFATELEVPGSFAAIDTNVSGGRATVFRELAKSEIRFATNDGRTIPFPDRSFDLIFHNSVIEHVPDPAAFNRETWRLLKPNGIVICITGTPALCRLRFIRDYLLRLPITMAGALVKESGLTRRLKISDQIKALLPKGVSPPSPAPSVSGWYARLFHYVYSPIYNAIVLDELARSAGLGKDEALAVAYDHFRNSAFNRVRYYLTPRTHGQHYRNFLHEMSEWKPDRWRGTFTTAGFDVVAHVPYRFHHLLETTWSGKINSALYHWAAPLIERYHRSIPPGLGSEFVLVARKN
ncbi:MAG TPA: class I SAM-dependent methyltransferase [Rhizomicrobium sp.]